MGIPHMIIGIAFLVNVISSLQTVSSGKSSDEEPVFF